MSELKLVIVPSLICGVSFGAAIEPYLSGKRPLPIPASATILLITAVFLLWILGLYRAAGKIADPSFPTSSFERYTPPIGASLSFVLGIAIVLFH